LCRMRGVILFVHPLGTGEPAKIYGHGCHVLIEAAEHQGKYAALNIPLPNTVRIQNGIFSGTNQQLY
uniref:2-oxoglutarate ferredoxin oxidoreductase subunit alpha n=1 Tax=Anisakis simplex TaxID=6269 RepID=A0A0M3JJN5_ANISI